MRSNLIKERKKKNLTQIQVAQIIDVTERHYKALEHGGEDMEQEQANQTFQEYKKKMHISLGITLSINAIAIALAILSFFI